MDFKKTHNGRHCPGQWVKGKSTLYYYFSSKEEIFERVVDEEMNHFFSDIEKAIDKASSARDKLKAYCKMRLRRLIRCVIFLMRSEMT